MTMITRTNTLQSDGAAVDPTDNSPPQPAGGKPLGGAIRKWRNRGIVLLMLVVAIWAGVHLTQAQAARSAKLSLADVVLTGQPIVVESTQPGRVTAVAIQAGDRVAKGQRLGVVAVTTTDSDGDPVTHHVTLHAPRAGVVVDDPVAAGSTLQAGVGFVTIYDPADLRLVTTVPLSYLSRISPGMSAELTAPGVPGDVTAVLQRAVPAVGTNDQDVPKGDLQLVFVARNANQVAELIPGLRFEGAIDTRTGAGNAKPAEYVA
jgi:multidrug resistance efflux pump